MHSPFNLSKPIAIGSDHAGFDYKEDLISFLEGKGLSLCGSANGMAITANKHQGVRAAICWGEELAQLARKHNNANIICIPARFVREGDAEKMVGIFMTTDFEGGRHLNRVEKIACG